MGASMRSRHLVGIVAMGFDPNAFVRLALDFIGAQRAAP
jgi:hypothetical protein